MALDTLEKRMNVVGVGRPWMRTKLPGTKDEAWRIASGNGYGGNTLAAYTVRSKFGTYRYKRDQAAGSGATATWSQARNERRSFQIFARADTSTSNFDIAVAALSDGNGNTIAASNLDVYRAHQIEVTEETYQNQAALDAGETLEGLGWYPDALIPTKHPVTGSALAAGKTYQALPFTLPANQTHTFLVDVFVPTTTIAGTYTGTVTVSADGQSDVEITVTLTVWNWGLPNTPALRTALVRPTTDQMYGNESSFAYLGWGLSDAQWENTVAPNIAAVLAAGEIAAQPFQVERAHDFKPEPNDTSGTYAVAAGQVTALQTHIDTHYPSFIQLLDPRRYGGPFTDADAEATSIAAWITAYAAGITSVARTEVTFAVYTQDEPTTAVKCDAVTDWGTPLYDGGVGSLVTTMITVPEKYVAAGMYSMIGSVTIWSITLQYYDYSYLVGTVEDTHTNTAVTERLAAGETVWMHVALSGGSDVGLRPFVQLDRPLLNYRLQPWLCRKMGATGWLYWAGGVHWWEIYADAGDPWTEPDTFDHSSGTFNSEGVLFYPADEDSIGYYGIVPSMRSFALRDGIQDYGYLQLCEDYGLTNGATEVAALITDFSDWETDPDEYQAARERIGDRLHLGNPNASTVVRRVGSIDSNVGRVATTDSTIGRVSGTDSSIGRVTSTDTVIGRVPQTPGVVRRV